MAELRIIDFQKEPEEMLISILDRFGAKVSDWMDKEYGLLVFIDVPDENLLALRKELFNHSNYQED